MAELGNMVTSSGGTSAEALYQLEKDTLRTALSKAIWRHMNEREHSVKAKTFRKERKKQSTKAEL